jgi:hypothetical protein
MDWGVPNGTTTTVAFVDGSASIYTSAGGGYIGGQLKEAINRAAKAAVTISASCVPDSHATTTFPLPTAGNVSFYLLTDQGVLSATRSVDELKAGSGPLFQLGNAMQEVNTQYRLLNDKN